MPEREGWVSRADLVTLVGAAELREMLSRGRRRMVERSWANQVAALPDFPEPVVIYPRDTPKPLVRLWLRADMERWMDGHMPAWRSLPPAPPETPRT